MSAAPQSGEKATARGPEANLQTWIALLGRHDTPTDGIEDYCHYLGRSLARRGVELKNVRVCWPDRGWLRSLVQLWRQCAGWDGNWILLQYTALAWSRRGFPFPALAVLAILRCRGLRCAVVFHDPYRQEHGSRWIDKVRGNCQDWVIRRLHGKAAKSIFIDPLEAIEWLPIPDSKAASIPIGANIPDVLPNGPSGRGSNTEKTVVVYCLSTVPNRLREIDVIAYAAQFAAANGVNLRLVFLGRGTGEAVQDIERAFAGSVAQVSNLGLQSADDVCRVLSRADAMLCVRGKLYPRRGSALAGVACGLPIIGFKNESNIFPLDQAGVILVPYNDREALAKALLQVISVSKLWEQLSQKSICAHKNYFSWDVIAGAFINALNFGLTRL